jgi:hypothetical protein
MSGLYFSILSFSPSNQKSRSLNQRVLEVIKGQCLELAAGGRVSKQTFHGILHSVGPSFSGVPNRILSSRLGSRRTFRLSALPEKVCCVSQRYRAYARSLFVVPATRGTLSARFPPPPITHTLSLLVWFSLKYSSR